MRIFLYGADTYRSREKLRDLIHAFEKKHNMSGVNLTRLDGSTLIPEGLGDVIRHQPFFGIGKRMVVVERLLGKKFGDIQTWIAILEGVPESTIVVIWDELDRDAAEKHPLVKHCMQSADTTRYAFDQLRGSALTRWIKERVDRSGSTISAEAVDRLVESTGGDLWSLASELAKLQAYRDGEVIREEDVLALTRSMTEENIFAIMDALAEKRVSQATSLVREQLVCGLEESYLFSMLSRHVRLLTQVRSYISHAPNATREELATALHLHPFVAQKLASAAPRFSSKTLLRLLDELFAAERGIKTGKMTTSLAIGRLLAAVALDEQR